MIKKENIKNILAELIFMYIGIWGMAEAFLSAFDIRLFNGLHSFVFGAPGTALYFFLKNSGKRITIRTVSSVSAVIIIFGFLMKSFLRYSALGLLNEMQIGLEIKKILPPDLFLGYAGFIFTFCMSVFLARGLKAAAFAAALLPMAAAAVCGRVPSAFSLALLVVFVLCESISDRVQYSLKYFYPAALGAAVFVLYAVISVIVPKEGYEKGSNMLADWFDKMQRGNEQKEAQAYGGIEDMRLGEYDTLSFTGEKILTLTTGVEGTVYLRGMTGGVYTGNSWEDLPEEYTRQYSDLFNRRLADVDAYSQSSRVLSVIENEPELSEWFFGSESGFYSSVRFMKYRVKYALENDNYWYLPYGNNYSVSSKSGLDGYPVGCGSRTIDDGQYAYDEFDYDAFKERLDGYEGDSRGIKSYREWELKYRDFVYKFYTGAYDSESGGIEGVLGELPKYSNTGKESDKFIYAESLKEYFEQNYIYTLSPGKLEEGEDFVSDFLINKKYGYCTSFASAAVLILRSQGIPSRYVCGYSVDVNDSAGSSERTAYERERGGYTVSDVYDRYTVEVTDSSAHAWAEIYIDGFGWLPFEFTPGYSAEYDVGGHQAAVNVKGGENEETAQQEQQTESQENAGGAEEAQEPQTQGGYSSIREYMADNNTGFIDFKIVFPILWRHFLSFLKILAYIFIGLCAAFVAVLIPSEAARRNNAKFLSFNDKQTPKQDNGQIIQIYRYIQKISRFLGIKQTDDMTGAAFAALLKQRFDFLTEIDIESVIYAIEKISYGRGNIGRAEMKRAVEAACEVRRKTFERQGRVKKLLFRFAWHLY